MESFRKNEPKQSVIIYGKGIGLHVTKLKEYFNLEKWIDESEVIQRMPKYGALITMTTPPKPQVGRHFIVKSFDEVKVELGLQ